MGTDDRNEGHDDGECVEHVWGTIEMLAASEGAYLEKACTRCAAVVVVTPDELGGWV